MTIREAFIQAASELGWPQQKIKDVLHQTASMIPAFHLDADIPVENPRVAIEAVKKGMAFSDANPELQDKVVSELTQMIGRN